MRGKELDPCSAGKAGKLLTAGKAKLADCKPFTIQLQFPTGENTPQLNKAAAEAAAEENSQLPAADTAAAADGAEKKYSARASGVSRGRSSGSQKTAAGKPPCKPRCSFKPKSARPNTGKTAPESEPDK